MHFAVLNPSSRLRTVFSIKFLAHSNSFLLVLLYSCSLNFRYPSFLEFCTFQYLEWVEILNFPHRLQNVWHQLGSIYVAYLLYIYLVACVLVWRSPAVFCCHFSLPCILFGLCLPTLLGHRICYDRCGIQLFSPILRSNFFIIVETVVLSSVRPVSICEPRLDVKYYSQ